MKDDTIIPNRKKMIRQLKSVAKVGMFIELKLGTSNRLSRDRPAGLSPAKRRPSVGWRCDTLVPFILEVIIRLILIVVIRNILFSVVRMSGFLVTSIKGIELR